MRDCCPMNAFTGSCEDGTCKSAAVPLGRFKKHNDMDGVFTVPASEQIIRICLAGLFALVVWATFEGHQEQQRMDRIAQEMGR